MKIEDAKTKLKDYATKGNPPGGFLSAVLSNDLTGAVGSADKDSLEILPDIVKWVFNELPSNVWGSPAKVNEHIKKKAKENNPQLGISL
jgi:hypothetical protein